MTANQSDIENTILPFPAKILLPSSPKRLVPINSLEPTLETEQQCPDPSPAINVPFSDAEQREREDVDFEDQEERQNSPQPAENCK